MGGSHKPDEQIPVLTPREQALSKAGTDIDLFVDARELEMLRSRLEINHRIEAENKVLREQVRVVCKASQAESMTAEVQHALTLGQELKAKGELEQLKGGLDRFFSQMIEFSQSGGKLTNEKLTAGFLRLKRFIEQPTDRSIQFFEFTPTDSPLQRKRRGSHKVTPQSVESKERRNVVKFPKGKL